MPAKHASIDELGHQLYCSTSAAVLAITAPFERIGPPRSFDLPNHRLQPSMSDQAGVDSVSPNGESSLSLALSQKFVSRASCIPIMHAFSTLIMCQISAQKRSAFINHEDVECQGAGTIGKLCMNTNSNLYLVVTFLT